MGLRTSAPAAAAPAPAASVPTSETGPKRVIDPEVKGQVAMHAIIAGYKVAGQLAPTLAASPEKVKETLHTLAVEVARQIEAYTFNA